MCFCVLPENASEISTLNVNLVSIETEVKGQSWRFQDPVVGNGDLFSHSRIRLKFEDPGDSACQCMEAIIRFGLNRACHRFE